MMTTQALSKQEVEFYKEHGYYLYKKPLFSAEKCRF